MTEHSRGCGKVEGVVATMSEADITILTILFLTCVVYSALLERIHDWYTPRRLVYTVIIGNGFIWLALANIEHYGTPLTAEVIFYALLSAGAPIYAWQLWQNWRRS